MIWIYSLIVLAFLFQESSAIAAVLVLASHNHINPWITHSLFVICTIIDISAGIALGTWGKRLQKPRWLFKGAKKTIGLMKKWHSSVGEFAGVVILGILTVPYVVMLGVIMGGAKRIQSAIAVFIGDIISYSLIILAADGLSSATQSIYIALLLILALGLSLKSQKVRNFIKNIFT